METKQLFYGGDYHSLPVTSVGSGQLQEVTEDVAGLTVQIVNICFIGRANAKDWVLVDGGMPGSADAIVSAAEDRYGDNARPQCIVLTHGHFDHVGALIELIRLWDVPVYAHSQELPYLTGRSSYPEPDPSAAGGLVAKMSPWFPIEPIQLGAYVHPLPEDGSVPHLPEWKWLHTPGHTPGHVSFYRERDRTLVAGDAFVNVKQESLYKVVMQLEELSGPPRYLTPDWETAARSVRMLQSLRPQAAITGHGKPIAGPELDERLTELATRFEEVAVPKDGKYVKH